MGRMRLSARSRPPLTPQESPGSTQSSSSLAAKCASQRSMNSSSVLVVAQRLHTHVVLGTRRAPADEGLGGIGAIVPMHSAHTCLSTNSETYVMSTCAPPCVTVEDVPPSVCGCACAPSWPAQPSSSQHSSRLVCEWSCAPSLSAQSSSSSVGASSTAFSRTQRAQSHSKEYSDLSRSCLGARDGTGSGL